MLNTSLSVASDEKICVDCNHKKPIDDFKIYWRRGRPYHSPRCDECRREKIKNYSLQYYYANLEHKKKQGRTAVRTKLTELRFVVLNHYGDGEICCKQCGFDGYEALQLDHINNDGNLHRKMTGSGIKLYRWIIKNDFPPIFQILCANCNHMKGKAYVADMVSRNLLIRSNVQ